MSHVRAFSLIELVIVTVIIGIIGAIAIPRLSRGSEGARVSAFVAELNTFANAADRYMIETGGTLADTRTGGFPPELAGYLHKRQWTDGSPLGGQWDIEANDTADIPLAIGVVFEHESPDLDALAQVDRLIDDGNFETGNFQNISAGRYYLILKH